MTNDPKLWKSIGISAAALVPVLLSTFATDGQADQWAAVAVAVLAPVVDKFRRMRRDKERRDRVMRG